MEAISLPVLTLVQRSTPDVRAPGFSSCQG